MDFYKEKLVKKKIDEKELILKSLIVSAVGVLIYASFSIVGREFGQWAFAFFISASVLFGAWYLFKHMSVQYEYAYCNGQFDIDIIYGQSKRKDLVVFDIDDCETITRYSVQNDPAVYNRSIAKKYYAVSFKGSKNSYAAIFNKNGVKTMVVFEADDEIINDVVTRNRKLTVN